MADAKIIALTTHGGLTQLLPNFRAVKAAEAFIEALSREVSPELNARAEAFLASGFSPEEIARQKKQELKEYLESQDESIIEEVKALSEKAKIRLEEKKEKLRQQFKGESFAKTIEQLKALLASNVKIYLIGSTKTESDIPDLLELLNEAGVPISNDNVVTWGRLSETNFHFGSGVEAKGLNSMLKWIHDNNTEVNPSDILFVDNNPHYLEVAAEMGFGTHNVEEPKDLVTGLNKGLGMHHLQEIHTKAMAELTALQDKHRDWVANDRFNNLRRTALQLFVEKTQQQMQVLFADLERQFQAKVTYAEIEKSVAAKMLAETIDLLQYLRTNETATDEVRVGRVHKFKDVAFKQLHQLEISSTPSHLSLQQLTALVRDMSVTGQLQMNEAANDIAADNFDAFCVQFENHEVAFDEIKSPFAKLEVEIDQLERQIDTYESATGVHDETIQHPFVLSLRALSHHLANEQVEQMANFPGTLPEFADQYKHHANHKLTEYTLQMLSDLRATPIADTEARLAIVKEFEKNCKQTSMARKVLTLVATVVFAAVGFILGAAIGAGIGMLAGVWAGPTAFFTAAVAAAKGGSVGLGLGLTAGAALAGGVAGGGGYHLYNFFKPTKERELVDAVVQNNINFAPQQGG